ncbi:hypothetical protein [Aurantimonas coralicida]|uniref:hypothetical protein n=1 Tax=Aurantimonas coralicida TaxID=182270 RepID=UPI001E2A9E21|nr:hypothetical protein [Aurantimonas coralicida]MCD1642574.1 hypothetical protein [Aurantimonas coralicida]
MKNYHEMTDAELESELAAWLAVIQAPTGPGQPTNAARRVAEDEIGKVEAWRARLALGVQ